MCIHTYTIYMCCVYFLSSLALTCSCSLFVTQQGVVPCSDVCVSRATRWCSQTWLLYRAVTGNPKQGFHRHPQWQPFYIASGSGPLFVCFENSGEKFVQRQKHHSPLRHKGIHKGVKTWRGSKWEMVRSMKKTFKVCIEESIFSFCSWRDFSDSLLWCFTFTQSIPIQ